MTSYISVPRDLSRVKTKIIFNLTRRQLLCFGAGILMGLPSYFAVKRLAGASVGTLVMIVIMLPLFLLAMYEKDGQPLEAHIHHFIQANIIRPRVRIYRTDNTYVALQRQEQVYKEVDAIVQTKNRAAPKSARKSDPGRTSANSGNHRKKPL